MAAAQQKNRTRIEAVRRPKGVPKNFAVGADVLLQAPKRGKVGRTIDRKRITCRVVAITKPFGLVKYKLRCNAGVLDGTYAASKLEPAPKQSAAELRFTGVGVSGVRSVTLNEAAAAQQAGCATVRCGCRGTCGRTCACRKKGVGCSRSCGCKACEGANCGNY